MSVKISIQRLLRKQLIRCAQVHNSCRAGGAVYEIPRHTLRLLEQTQDFAPSPPQLKLDSESKFESDSESRPPVVVVVNSTTTTTSDRRATAAHLQQICDRLDLAQFKIGANDLLGPFEAGAFQDEIEFIESLDHIAFYLRSSEAAGIRHPKAWFLRQLVNGYYPPPSGFISYEERVAELRLKARQEKLRHLKELEKQEFDTTFEIWLTGTPTADLKALLGGSFFADDPSSPGARSMLREHFAAQTQRAVPQGPDAEQ